MGHTFNQQPDIGLLGQVTTLAFSPRCRFSLQSRRECSTRSSDLARLCSPLYHSRECGAQPRGFLTHQVSNPVRRFDPLVCCWVQHYGNDEGGTTPL